MEEAKRYKTEAAQRDAFVKICHDMRTPLSSVMHLAQILEIEADSPDRVRERAAEIAVSAEYLLGLADDIVDIYKLGGGRIDIKKEPFSPYELAEDIQKMLCPQIKDAGHELAVCIAEAAPDMLLGDKRRSSIRCSIRLPAVRLCFAFRAPKAIASKSCRWYSP